MACCPACHFAREERLVLPYLSEERKRWLLREHAALRDAGYPRDAVEKHADAEMPVFAAAGVPRWIIERIELDHATIEFD